MDYDQVVKILKTIAKDQEDDASSFDGKPFNGRTVAEYFGNQGAAIAALANILKSLVENLQENAHPSPSITASDGLSHSDDKDGI